MFDADNYTAALAEFEKAYEMLEGHPKRFFVLHSIGMCHERLFRYDLAMRYYRRYLIEGGANAPDRDEVEKTVHDLERLLGTLHLQTNVAAEVWIGDRLMGEAPGDVLVPGGQRAMELRAPGYESVKREIVITAGEEQSLQIELSKLEEHEGLSPAYFWTGAALTVAVAGAGTVFGLMAQSKQSEGEDLTASEGNVATAKARALEDDAGDLALKADILFGSAALLAVGTGILYFMTDWDGGRDDRDEEGTPARSSARIRIAPVVDTHGVTLHASGRF